MKYRKPPLTFEQQADQLIRRGMAGERDIMISRLQAVSYYRLSGYWYPFRKPAPDGSDRLLDDFRTGTTFDAVWRRYAFDRRLRLLVLDAIERIEIAVRSQIAYDHAHHYGPFAYATDPAALPDCQRHHRDKLLKTVRNICAHHGRLWNRELGTKPKIPAKDEAWNKPVKVDGHRAFGVLTLCKWCLDRIAAQSSWTERLVALLNEFSDVPRGSMGFPGNWQDCPIWGMASNASREDKP